MIFSKKKSTEIANCLNACSQKIYAKLLNNLLTNSRCKKGIYGSDQCENIGFLAQVSILHYSIHIDHNFEFWKSYLDNVFYQFQQLGTNCRFVITKSQQPIRAKVVNSREVREVVEGTTCISDKKLSKLW